MMQSSIHRLCLQYTSWSSCSFNWPIHKQDPHVIHEPLLVTGLQKQYPIPSPVVDYDTKTPMIVGSTFPSMDELKLALRHYAIRHETDYNTEKSDTRRMRVYCSTPLLVEERTRGLTGVLKAHPSSAPRKSHRSSAYGNHWHRCKDVDPIDIAD